MLVGMTGDWECYRTQDYAEESDRVKAVAECFGPTDIQELVQVRLGIDLNAPGPYSMPKEVDSQMGLLLSDEQGQISVQKVRDMSPLLLASPGKEYPPFLILHGDADPVVPYSQSEDLYQKLDEMGYEARMVRVTGGVHEGNFWTPELIQLVWDYFKENL